MAFGKQKEEKSKSIHHIHLIHQLNSFKIFIIDHDSTDSNTDNFNQIIAYKTDPVCTGQKKKHTVPIYLSTTIPVVAEKIKFTFLSKTKWNVSLIFVL